MAMYYLRRGTGKPLLLIHGIGSSHRSWNRIVDGLAAEREVVALDLPGFGASLPLPGEVSIRTLADAVTGFLQENDLLGIDAVG
ncbi:MAG: alpha/beta fold hydrolase, partial [Ferruginibacter sp.]|nr:alpha/beta fold hydrolase [Cytophagales bacterium]